MLRLCFLFSEENKTLIETRLFYSLTRQLTNGTGLCTKIQPYGTCTSDANAVRPHEPRAQNDATISPGAYNTTNYFLTHVIDERQQLVHSTSYLTVLVPLSMCIVLHLHPHDTGHFFQQVQQQISISRHFNKVSPDKGRTLSHPLPAKHGLPNVRFAPATHARALHAHNKSW